MADTITIPPAPAPAPAAPSAATQAGKKAAEVVQGIAGKATDAVTGVVNDPKGAQETVEGWGKKAADFFSNLKAGNVIGAILGGIGAWFISSMFGAGPFQTILMVLLLPLGAYLGASVANDWGKDNAAKPAGDGKSKAVQPPSPQQQQQQQQQNPGVAVSPPPPLSFTPSPLLVFPPLKSPVPRQTYPSAPANPGASVVPSPTPPRDPSFGPNDIHHGA
jgi:hypothetical protein